MAYQDKQRTLLEYMIADETAFTRCRSMVRDVYFDPDYQGAVRFIQDYSDQYRCLPTPKQIECETNVVLVPPAETNDKHAAWFLDQIERFCKRKALESAIFSGPDLIADNRFGELEALVKEAMQVGLQRGLGVSYYADPKGRATTLRERNKVMTTGWATLDKELYGGFNRGELNIFAGGSGAGKSLFLQNIARNWSLLGLNVVYISLELSELLISNRLDGMNMGLSTKDLWGCIDEVDQRIRKLGETAGDITVVQMGAGTTANQIRAFLREHEIATGLKVDALVVDYLDLMGANNEKIDPSDMFTKDKFVSEELRGLAIEWNALLATASQLNRSAVQAEGNHDHSHIAGGLSKINTADNVMTIYAPDDLKAKGQVRLQLIKTRSSGGVGKKIVLSFSPASLVIADFAPGQGPTDDDGGPDDASLLDKINNMRNIRSSIVTRTAAAARPPGAPPPRSEAASLHATLRNLGK
jgi:archaellum biogenesis ATPase FlaH